MRLKVIGSGSKGNCYLLYNDEETLIIECGINLKEIKKALKFDLSRVAGCIMTHEHNDHSSSAEDLLKAGVNIYSTEGTFKAKGLQDNHRAKAIDRKGIFHVGGFTVMSFDIHHDASDPIGFLINHKEMGTALFLTDTYYSGYKFKGLNNIIIEANHSRKIIDSKMDGGYVAEFLRNRIIKSHMSLENCMKLLDANDLSAVNNIVLIHLSDSNSHEKDFQRDVQDLTGKNVSVASNGMDINFNMVPI
jgi:phosphoribosyl 1,2-cyclic phosphodiesterase